MHSFYKYWDGEIKWSVSDENALVFTGNCTEMSI